MNIPLDYLFCFVLRGIHWNVWYWPNWFIVFTPNLQFSPYSKVTHESYWKVNDQLFNFMIFLSFFFIPMSQTISALDRSAGVCVRVTTKTKWRRLNLSSGFTVWSCAVVINTVIIVITCTQMLRFLRWSKNSLKLSSKTDFVLLLSFSFTLFQPTIYSPFFIK